MLGEDHSLAKEFPDLLDTITSLVKRDEAFAKDTKRYNALDKEIRVLELNGAPIDDEAMHQLKHDRSVLKDSLYQRLKKA
ncbi:YdcH family protein [Agarivorans sp. TSD2052]|uniref:YdcH family protein n=1 Tax=Agarivorans sp. TSD2052 TaxID=2937286 RepID=UPI00200DCF10|nr:YdcH family protein [Agarivorans sp. TSD2052]UPW17614.1 YdcH family protein [Agarivorans sp. TSD2052]